MADNDLMNSEAGALPETGTDVFAVDVSDDVLERAAAVTGGCGFTMIYCTQDLSCGDF